MAAEEEDEEEVAKRRPLSRKWSPTAVLVGSGRVRRRIMCMVALRACVRARRERGDDSGDCQLLLT